MEYKILNLRDALKLASILSPYLDTDLVKEMSMEDFGIFLMATVDVFDIVKLEGVFNLKVEDEDFPSQLASGISQLGVFDLLKFYRDSFGDSK